MKAPGIFPCLLFALSLLFLFDQRVNACVSATLGPGPPLCVFFTKASSVYLAELVEDPRPSDKANYENLIFQIKETFKGEKQDRIEMLNQSQESNDCDLLLSIKKGETWIIFVDSGANSAYVNENSFSFNPERDKKKLELLRTSSVGKNPTTIHGSVRFLDRYIGRYKSRIKKVTLTGQGLIRRTRTDKFGSFSFSELSEGTFKMRVWLPVTAVIYRDQKFERARFDTKTRSYYFEDEVTIKNAECLYRITAIFSPRAMSD